MEINDTIYVNYIPTITDVDIKPYSGEALSIGATPSANIIPASNERSNEIVASRGVIANWDIYSSRLTSGNSNIVLDSLNKAISINSETYGAAGIQLQYNAGTPRFYVGDGSTQYVQFDGTNLTIGGKLTAGELHIPDEDVTANSFHVESDGDTFWGATQSSFTADNDNASAYVLKDGTAKFQSVSLVSNVVISGLQAGSALGVEFLSAGTITSKSITLAVSGGTGDVEIRAGIASGDFDNSGAASGFILGIDDSDSDTAKFYFGAPEEYIEWDGTSLTVSGDIKAGKRVYFYGDGAEGTLTATGSTTINGTKTNIDSAAAAAQAVVPVATTTGYTVGDHVLIHQTQGTGAGLWEIKKIASISAGVSLTMTKNLVNSYAATGAQVIEIKEHTDVIFKGSASIADAAWDGTDGGVVVLYSSEGVLIENGTSINVDELGFRGGAGHVDISFQGEGEDGNGTQSVSINGVGAGGQPDTGGTGSRGAGGGLKETGQDGDGGSDGGYNIIDATTTYTDANGNMILLFGGGGGGNHASTGGNERTGGKGGGILIIIAPFIWVGGAISAAGGPGVALGGNNDSGAGAGGVVALFSEQIFGLANVTVAGGTPVNIGAGGDGYILTGIPGGLPTS